jgi:hypothetical protein
LTLLDLENKREYQRRYQAANRERVRAWNRKWYAKNRLSTNANTQEWYAENKERVRALKRRERYGVLDGRSEGTCELCGEFSKKIHLDHDHTTGKVRGWLCSGCNNGLGQFKDDTQRLRAAILYLERHADGNRDT